MSQHQALTDTLACFALAKKLFNVDLSGVEIRFDLHSKRTIGMACARGNMFERRYLIRYNPARMKNYDAFKPTIPHEVAHIVCYMRPELGSRHNPGWKRVCRALGGDGQRCASFERVAAMSGNADQPIQTQSRNKFKYTSPRGVTIEVSHLVHSRIQCPVKPTVYVIKSTKEKILPSYWVRPGQVAAPAEAPRIIDWID